MKRITLILILLSTILNRNVFTDFVSGAYNEIVDEESRDKNLGGHYIVVTVDEDKPKGDIIKYMLRENPRMNLIINGLFFFYYMMRIMLIGIKSNKEEYSELWKIYLSMIFTVGFQLYIFIF